MDTRGGPSKLSLRAERVGSCSRLIHKQSWTGLYREACNFASKVVVQHSFSNRFVTFPWDFSYFTIYFKRGFPVPVHAAKSAFPGIEIGTLIPLLRISIFCHFGSTSFVLPIRPKNSILNRVIRVHIRKNKQKL